MTTINIELVYALPENQTLLKLAVPRGTTLSEAIMLSNITKQYPEISLEAHSVGIFSKRVAEPQSYVMQPNDRIEIYRLLLADPKEVRRKRAQKVQDKNKL